MTKPLDTPPPEPVHSARCCPLLDPMASALGPRCPSDPWPRTEPCSRAGVWGGPSRQPPAPPPQVPRGVRAPAVLHRHIHLHLFRVPPPPPALAAQMGSSSALPLLDLLTSRAQAPGRDGSPSWGLPRPSVNTCRPRKAPAGFWGRAGCSSVSNTASSAGSEPRCSEGTAARCPQPAARPAGRSPSGVWVTTPLAPLASCSI